MGNVLRFGKSDAECTVRAQLERDVVVAVECVYATRDATEFVRDEARRTERETVRALDQHIKEHGCKAPK